MNQTSRKEEEEKIKKNIVSKKQTNKKNMRRNKDNKQTNKQNKQKHKQKQKMTERIIFSCNFRLEEKKIENGYFFEPPKSIWHETLLKKDKKKVTNHIIGS